MEVIHFIFEALKMLILVEVILSWVMPDKNQFPRNYLTQLTDPLYRPIRSVLKPEKTGNIDFSPIVIFIGLSLLQSLI